MLSADRINELLRLDDEALLNAHDAAAVVGLEYNTLNWYRQHALERSPKFCRVGSRAVRYRMGDLRAYIAARSEG